MTSKQQKAYGDKYRKATDFFKMLSPKGKLGIMHNLQDDALWWSSNTMNWEDRLGQRGTPGQYKSWNQSWHPDKKLILVEILSCYSTSTTGISKVFTLP